jgi:cytochrome P450
LLGNELVTSEGDYCRRQCSLANPAFRPARREQYLKTMGACTRQVITCWTPQTGPRIDAQAEMTGLTLAIAERTLFGLDLSTQSERASRGFDTALAAIARRGPANLQVPLWVPTPGNLRFRRALRELDTIVYDIIRRFHAGQAENADQTLLGAYMAARDPESGEGMNDRQLRDEVVTLYLAGHETTASLLTWALYWLARRPDIAERVTAEIDRHIFTDNPCSDDLKALEYTTCFIRRFNVEPLDEPEIGCVAAGTLRPDQTIWIRLVRRD